MWIKVEDELPKNGKKVIATFENSMGKRRMIFAYYTEAKQIESGFDSDFGEYDEETDCYYDPEGWYEIIENTIEYTAIFHMDGEITHWMELPQYP